MAFVFSVIAASWWLWLGITILGLGCAVYFMGRYFNPSQPEVESSSSGHEVFGAFENMAVALLAVLVGLIGLVFLAVTTFVHLFNYNSAVGFWTLIAVVGISVVWIIIGIVRWSRARGRYESCT